MEERVLLRQLGKESLLMDKTNDEKNDLAPMRQAAAMMMSLV